MPPKKGATKGLDIIKPSSGRTKQQKEDDELKMMQELTEKFVAAAKQQGTKGQPGGGKVVTAGKAKKAAAQRQKTDEEIAVRREMLERDFEAAHAQLMEAAVYENEYVPLADSSKEWFHAGKNKWVRYEQFQPEYLEPVVKLLTVSLSEPYNAFTYKYFLSGWPDLGVVAFGIESESAPAASDKGELIGVVISKVARKQPIKPLRGYIAMLAVAESFRGVRLGQRLVTVTVDLMKKKDVQEVCLETPTSNDRALQLYLGLGFVKHKFLTRYYLDGQDAVRLKLWLTSPFTQPPMPDKLKDAFAIFNRSLGQLKQMEAMYSGAPGAAAIAAAAASE